MEVLVVVFQRLVRWRRYVCPGRLSADGARAAIKQRAKQAGIEGSISGHSLRTGSAISLAQAGAGIPDMQVVGRWKDSNIPARYASAQLAARSTSAFVYQYLYCHTNVW